MSARRRDEPVRLTRIYTRAGDKGETSLGDGSRVPKLDCRIGAFGTVDELNSALGVALAEPGLPERLREPLARIQNDLFDVEAELCLATKGPGGAALTVTAVQVAWLEGEIDRFNEDLQPLKSFVLPGGSAAAAYLHLARTVCRRAERIMVELKDQPGEDVSSDAIKYVNRLSDFLFVASRFMNGKGETDVLWAPGQNR